MLTWWTRRAWPALKTTVIRWNSDDGFLLSAAMAYYVTFSLFPLCLVLIAGIGLIARLSPQIQDQQVELLNLARQNAGPWLADQLHTMLMGVQTQAAVGGPLGLLTLLLAVFGIFIQLQNTFDRIWEEPPQESTGWVRAMWQAFHDRINAFLVLICVGAFMVAVFLGNVALSGIKSYVEQLPLGRPAWQTLQTGGTLLANSLLLAILYKTLPRAAVRWGEAFSGGIFAAVIWQIGQQVLVSVVIGQKYTAYGVLGTFIAVMLWFYYASAVVFLGAEFVRAICKECRGDERGQEE